MTWTTHKTWISWIVLAIVKQRIAWQLKVGIKVRASDTSRKKAKFRGIFMGKFAEKSADFAGKKSKFAQKSANFAGFSRQKRQNLQKNRSISRDFSRKKSNFEGFRGKFLEKSAYFTGNLGGNFAKKQSIFRNQKPCKVEDKSAHFQVSWPIKFSVASRVWPKKAKWITRNPEGIVCPIPLQWGQSFEFRGEGAGFFSYGCHQFHHMNKKNWKSKLPFGNKKI